MTETLFIIWSAVAAAATAVLLGLLAAGALRRRRRSRDAVLRTRYLQVVMMSLMSREASVPRLPLIRRAGARRLLAQTVGGVVGATYGLDIVPLRRIVAEYGVDEWLLRRIRRVSGFRRARYLALLAQLPSDADVVSRIARFARSRNPYVRFHALLVRLVADPSTALRLMAEYPSPFTSWEVSEIMSVLRRGMLPIAYEPLLTAPERNLRCIGLGIVRQFGIEEAERHLLRIVARDAVPELGCEALYALCSMRRPLTPELVSARIAALEPFRRKSLLRYMAAEGYSPAALEKLFDRQERPYYESLVLSYKRTLACR